MLSSDATASVQAMIPLGVQSSSLIRTYAEEYVMAAS